MPISDCRGTAAKPFMTDYWNKDGKRRQILHHSRIEAEVELLNNAGPRSSSDLFNEVSVDALFEHIWRRKEEADVGNIAEQRTMLSRQVLDRIGRKKVHEVTKADFNAILRVLKSQMNPRSLGSRCGTIEGMFDVAVFRNCCVANLAREAFKDVERTFASGPLVSPDAMDIATLENNLAGWVAIQLGLYVDAGLTSGEAAALPWCNVDLAAGKLLVAVRARDGKILPLKRRRKPRVVPLGKRLWEALLTWKEHPQADPKYVIGDGNGHTLGQHRLLQPLYRHQIQLGIVAPVVGGSTPPAWAEYKGKFPRYQHEDFRYRAAVQWHQEGVAAKVIARRLGMKTSQSIMRMFDAKPDPLDLAVMASFDQGLKGLLNSARPTTELEGRSA